MIFDFSRKNEVLNRSARNREVSFSNCTFKCDGYEFPTHPFRCFQSNIDKETAYLVDGKGSIWIPVPVSIGIKDGHCIWEKRLHRPDQRFALEYIEKHFGHNSARIAQIHVLWNAVGVKA